MQFSELMNRLRQLNYDDVGDLKNSEHDAVMIGHRDKIGFPPEFQFHTLYKPAGQDDWMVTDDEVAALRRRFGITDDCWFVHRRLQR